MRKTKGVSTATHHSPKETLTKGLFFLMEPLPGSNHVFSLSNRNPSAPPRKVGSAAPSQWNSRPTACKCVLKGRCVIAGGEFVHRAKREAGLGRLFHAKRRDHFCGAPGMPVLASVTYCIPGISSLLTRRRRARGGAGERENVFCKRKTKQSVLCSIVG